MSVNVGNKSGNKKQTRKPGKESDKENNRGTEQNGRRYTRGQVVQQEWREGRR